MKKPFISLKSNFKKRISEALTPSLEDQIYSIQDFTSPGFLDELLSFHTLSARSTTKPHLSSTPLISFIDSVTQKIDDAKLLLDNLRERCIRRAVLFCTEENKEYEVDNLKREITKSHLKIVQYGYNPSIVEEFVQLFDRYKKLNEKKQLFKANESMDDFMRCFDEKIESIVQVCKEDKLLTPHMVAIEQIEDSGLQMSPEIQDKVVLMHERKIFDMDIKLLERNRQNYLIFISTVPPRLPQQIWKSQLEVLNLKSGTFGHPLRLPDRQPKDVLPFQVIDSLNLVVTPNFQSLLLNLYKLSDKKMQLVWRFPVRSIFTNGMIGIRFVFEMIKPQNILAVGWNQDLKLLNIFTKKVIYEDKTNISSITAISHMKSLNLLVVLGNQGSVSIYSILGNKNFLRLEHTIQIKTPLYAYNQLKNIFLQSNSFITAELSSNTIILHRVQFHLDKIKQDRFDTKITSKNGNYIGVASNSSQLLLSYLMISPTADAVSCAGTRTLGVSGEKLGDVDLFMSGSMIILFDSTERMVGYNTINNSIIMMSKKHDGEFSHQERYLKYICMPFLERIMCFAEREEATTDQRIISTIIDDLKRLTTILGEKLVVKDENALHPPCSLINDIWDILNSLSTKFSKVAPIMNELEAAYGACIRAVGINFFCRPSIEKIAQLTQREEATTDEKIISAIKDELKNLFRILEQIVDKDENVSDLLKPLLQDIWSNLKILFTKFNQVDTIIVKLCQVVKKFIKALDADFLPYALEYLEIIQKGFLALPLPEFLYALEMSVSAVGDVPKMIEPLTETYELVSKQALQLLNSGNVQGDDELYDETCEDFFGLMSRYTKHLPSIILSSKTLEESLQLAQTAMGKDQLKVKKVLCMFLEYLFKLTRDNPQNDVEKAATKILLNNYGGIYIKLFFFDLMEYSSQELKDYICDVIFASFTNMKKQTIQWIKDALEKDFAGVLSKSVKKDMLKNLDKIDVSNLKPGQSDKERARELDRISEEFYETFEIFDCEEY